MCSIKEKKEKLTAQSDYTFSDLCDIISILRSPEGCPWDREQTHESIRKNFIEETYEVVEAIDDDDRDHLLEELGDVLLQILLHCEMEKENNSFDISDVINGISEKLIHRHPHVFKNIDVSDSSGVEVNWDNIKKEEKGHRNIGDELAGISRTLPSLMRMQKIIKKSGKRGLKLCENDASYDRLDEDDYAKILMKLCKSANEKGIDLEQLLGQKCNFITKNVQKI